MFQFTNPPFNPFSGSHQSRWQAGGGAWYCNCHKSVAPCCLSGQCTWLKHQLPALGTRGWLDIHSGPHSSTAQGEEPLGVGTTDPKITRGWREE